MWTRQRHTFPEQSSFTRDTKFAPSNAWKGSPFLMKNYVSIIDICTTKVILIPNNRKERYRDVKRMKWKGIHQKTSRITHFRFKVLPMKWRCTFCDWRYSLNWIFIPFRDFKGESYWQDMEDEIETKFPIAISMVAHLTISHFVQITRNFLPRGPFNFDFVSDPLSTSLYHSESASSLWKKCRCRPKAQLLLNLLWHKLKLELNLCKSKNGRHWGSGTYFKWKI